MIPGVIPLEHHLAGPPQINEGEIGNVCHLDDGLGRCVFFKERIKALALLYSAVFEEVVQDLFYLRD